MTGVKVTAWETNKKNTDPRNTFDNDFDDDDYNDYGSNFREDTETHPALQMFGNFQQPPMGHSRSASGTNTASGYKKNFTGYHPKANSYAGFLMDKGNTWKRKISRSKEKKSTDDGLLLYMI